MESIFGPIAENPNRLGKPLVVGHRFGTTSSISKPTGGISRRCWTNPIPPISFTATLPIALSDCGNNIGLMICSSTAFAT